MLRGKRHCNLSINPSHTVQFVKLITMMPLSSKMPAQLSWCLPGLLLRDCTPSFLLLLHAWLPVNTACRAVDRHSYVSQATASLLHRKMGQKRRCVGSVDDDDVGLRKLSYLRDCGSHITTLIIEPEQSQEPQQLFRLRLLLLRFCKVGSLRRHHLLPQLEHIFLLFILNAFATLFFALHKNRIRDKTTQG